MRFKHLLITCTAMLLALAVVAPGVAAGKAGGTDRPVKGTLSGSTTTDTATGLGTGQGTGNISHLGKVTYTQNLTATVTGPTTVALSGTGTLVAANGDQVFYTFTGTATPPSLVPAVGQTIPVTFDTTITGGTGRFADASGTVTTTGQAVIVSVAGTTFSSRDTTTLEGRISY